MIIFLRLVFLMVVLLGHGSLLLASAAGSQKARFKEPSKVAIKTSKVSLKQRPAAELKQTPSMKTQSNSSNKKIQKPSEKKLFPPRKNKVTKKAFAKSKQPLKPSVDLVLNETQNIAAEESVNRKSLPTENQSSTRHDTVKITPAKINDGYRSNLAPKYPTLSKKRNEEGRVILKVEVSSKGSAERVVVDQSSGWSRLDKAALEAVLNWEFEPGQKDGKPVSSYVFVPVTFRLKHL